MGFSEKFLELTIEENCVEGVALSTRDYTILKVVQATHNQGDIGYSVSRGIPCSCISLITVSLTLFKSPGLWDKFDLNFILGKAEQLFKFIGKFRYLAMEDLPQELFIETAL